MTRDARKSLFSFVGLLALLAMTATVAEAADKGDKVAYRLKWLRNVSVVGALYAEGRGLFEQQGLTVEVKAGGPERDAIRELELGYADFGEEFNIMDFGNRQATGIWPENNSGEEIAEDQRLAQSLHQ